MVVTHAQFEVVLPLALADRIAVRVALDADHVARVLLADDRGDGVHPAARPVKRIDLLVLGLLLRKVRSRQHDLPVELRELFVRERTAALAVRQIVLGLVLLDGTLRSAHFFGEFAEPPLGLESIRRYLEARRTLARRHRASLAHDSPFRAAVDFALEEAEHAAQYLGKGSHVNVVGRLRNDHYEHDGEEVYTLGFTADEITLFHSLGMALWDSAVAVHVAADTAARCTSQTTKDWSK